MYKMLKSTVNIVQSKVVTTKCGVTVLQTVAVPPQTSFKMTYTDRKVTEKSFIVAVKLT